MNSFKRSLVVPAAVVGLGVFFQSAPAFAAEPTAPECLAASDKWIGLRDQRLLVAARSELLVCASASCPAEVREECSQRIAELNAAIPTVVFEAKDAGGGDLSAVKVSVDGKPLADRLEGASLAVDPGEHTFVFEVAGSPAVTKRIIIAQGAKDRREVVLFGAPSGEGAGHPGDTGAGGDPGATQRILGFSALGVSAVALTVGIVFEVKRSSKLSDRDDLCPHGECTGDAAKAREVSTLTSDARSASTIGTVSLIASGLFAAGGLALVFTAPHAGSPPDRVSIAPMVTPWVQGILVRGASF